MDAPDAGAEERFELALRAVREAAWATEAVSASWAVDEGRRASEARAKADASPVTVADLAAQILMAHTIGSDAPRRAEETSVPLGGPQGTALAQSLLELVRERWPGARPDDLRRLLDAPPPGDPRSPHWILDPVDGTSGFLRGMQYAICLAYLEGGAPTVGVLGCPHLGPEGSPDPSPARPPGRLVAARRGSGTVEIDLADDARRHVAAAPWRPGQVVRIGVPWEPRHANREAVDAWLGRAGLPYKAVAVDSQAKYALVARGDIHAYLRIPTDEARRENVWDHAAGFVVATEAGALVTDIDGHELDFTRGATLEANRGILCATPAVHAALLEAC
ncbi:MAG: inositol monophosphatase family protein [Planctomycetota bacterium]